MKKDCALLEQFLQNKRKYIAYKHQNTKEYNKEVERKITKFLEFACLKKGVERIQDINKSTFDDFMTSISDRSLETQRKYRLALSEFIERARLDFKIIKNVNKQKERKYYELKKLLEKFGFDAEQCKSEIVKIL